MADVKVKKPESSGPPKRYNYSRFQPKKGNQETKFDGRCDDIKGFVFDCADGKQADRYNTTIQEITAYTGRTYEYGGDIRWSIKNEKKYVPTKPDDVGTTARATDKRIWEKNIDAYVRRKAKLTANCEKLYSLILGQCTEHMVSKLESLDGFKEIERALDVIKLMKAIKGVSYQFEGQKYEDEALHQAMKRFYLFNQNREMTSNKFLETFQTLISVITECGGEIGHNPTGIIRALKEKGRGLASATPRNLMKQKQQRRNVTSPWLCYPRETILATTDLARSSKTTIQRAVITTRKPSLRHITSLSTTDNQNQPDGSTTTPRALPSST
jgi:hypothetical protein